MRARLVVFSAVSACVVYVLVTAPPAEPDRPATPSPTPSDGGSAVEFVGAVDDVEDGDRIRDARQDLLEHFLNGELDTKIDVYVGGPGGVVMPAPPEVFVPPRPLSEKGKDR